MSTERRTEIKRSDMFNHILSIVKKLKLEKCDKDHCDHISITCELEEYFKSHTDKNYE